MNLKELEWEGVDWIDLCQDMNKGRAFVSTVRNLPVP
jgi:hypothetical protein